MAMLLHTTKVRAAKLVMEVARRGGGIFGRLRCQLGAIDKAMSGDHGASTQRGGMHMDSMLAESRTVRHDRRNDRKIGSGCRCVLGGSSLNWGRVAEDAWVWKDGS